MSDGLASLLAGRSQFTWTARPSGLGLSSPKVFRPKRSPINCRIGPTVAASVYTQGAEWACPATRIPGAAVGLYNGGQGIQWG
jgi:hypothetical protein